MAATLTSTEIDNDFCPRCGDRLALDPRGVTPIVRERVAEALFNQEVERVGRDVKWDHEWPAEPNRSEWLKIADVAIAACTNRPAHAPTAEKP